MAIQSEVLISSRVWQISLQFRPGRARRKCPQNSKENLQSPGVSFLALSAVETTSDYNIARQPEIAIWPPKPEIVIPLELRQIGWQFQRQIWGFLPRWVRGNWLRVIANFPLNFPHGGVSNDSGVAENGKLQRFRWLFFGYFRDEASVIIWRYAAVIGFTVIPKCMTLNDPDWLFRVKFCFFRYVGCLWPPACQIWRLSSWQKLECVRFSFPSPFPLTFLPPSHSPSSTPPHPHLPISSPPLPFFPSSPFPSQKEIHIKKNDHTKPLDHLLSCALCARLRFTVWGSFKVAYLPQLPPCRGDPWCHHWFPGQTIHHHEKANAF